jgi:preprotein translocase subunit SecE
MMMDAVVVSFSRFRNADSYTDHTGSININKGFVIFQRICNFSGRICNFSERICNFSERICKYLKKIVFEKTCVIIIIIIIIIMMIIIIIIIILLYHVIPLIT